MRAICSTCANNTFTITISAKDGTGVLGYTCAVCSQVWPPSIGSSAQDFGCDQTVAETRDEPSELVSEAEVNEGYRATIEKLRKQFE